MDSVWDVLWTIMIFFFWVMYIWIFITFFTDILRRNDLGGWAKAGWLIFLIFIPLLGALVYLIARPKMTEQDKQIMESMEQQEKRAAGFSPAEEIAKAQALKDSGAITDAEFEELKRRAMA